MTRNKKIIIGILIVAIGWICFRVAVVTYALYQDGWRLGDWRSAIAEVGDYIKYKASTAEEGNDQSVDIKELKIQEQAIRAKYTDLIEKEKREGCFEIYEEGTAKGDFCGESYDKVNEWLAQEKEEINNLYAL